jgi:cytochrome c-type biogenesis protein CcmH/NrfF
LGWDETEIKTYFVEQYGDRVLATPPATGLNWLVYVLPPVVFIFGAGVLFHTFRNWRRQPIQSVSQQVVEDEKDPYLELLEEELRKRS